MGILKPYFRYLSRNRFFTLVNVLGLSISLMFVLLITDMVIRQLTVDKDIEDVERIHVLTTERYATSHYIVGRNLEGRYPAMEDWCIVSPAHLYALTEESEDKKVVSTYFAKDNFCDFFRMEPIAGDVKTMLLDNHGVVLTEQGANKIFGSTDVLGRTVNLLGNAYTVKGVVRGFRNSMFSEELDVILPFYAMKYYYWGISMESPTIADMGCSVIFARFVEGYNPAEIEDDMLKFFKEFHWAYQQGFLTEAHWIPMRDAYFAELPIAGLNQYSMKNIYVYSVAGVLILLMALFNYVSMSVAQTANRAKEMSTRRLLGASRRDIFMRMMTEAAVMTLVAFLLGFLFALAVEPFAAVSLMSKIDLMESMDVLHVAIYVAIVAAVSVVAGLVPAAVLSAYNPMDVVRGTFRRKTKSLYLRLLYVVQSMATIALLTCAGYVGVQIYRIVHTPMGYDHENVLLYYYMDRQKADLFRTELAKLPYVEGWTISDRVPPEAMGESGTFSNGETEATLTMVYINCDTAFAGLYGIDVTEAYSPYGAYLSHHAAQSIGLADGATAFFRLLDGQTLRAEIAGRTADWTARTALEPKRDVFLDIHKEGDEGFYPMYISVKLRPGEIGEWRKEIDALYRDIYGTETKGGTLFDDLVRWQYYSIYRLRSTVGIFACVALLITLLGLTAMSLYFIAQRKRDMAVRKVFGSDNRLEMLRLMRFSLVSLLAGLVMAVPLIWAGVRQIDKIVAYEGAFPWWVALAAFAVVAGVSLLSVWLISRKAVRENPVKNLKTE